MLNMYTNNEYTCRAEMNYYSETASYLNRITGETSSSPPRPPQNDDGPYGHNSPFLLVRILNILTFRNETYACLELAGSKSHPPRRSLFFLDATW